MFRPANATKRSIFKDSLALNKLSETDLKYSYLLSVDVQALCERPSLMMK